MLSLLFLAAALAAEPEAIAPSPACSEAVRGAELLVRLDEAAARYAELDIDGFLDTLAEVEGVLPCVDDAVSPHLAAALHRMVGLRSFLDRDPARSTTAFAAARAIEPTYTFPEELVPAGNAVLDEYVAIDPAASPMERLPAPVNGWLDLDGRTTNERPTARPVVFQHLAWNGAVLTTRYLLPGEAPPAYEVRGTPAEEPAPLQAAAPSPTPPPEVVRPRAGKPLRTVLGLTAAAAGGVALASWGGSHAVHGSYEKTTDVGRAETLYQRTNTLVYLSAGAAVLSAGTGVGALLVADF